MVENRAVFLFRQYVGQFVYFGFAHGTLLEKYLFVGGIKIWYFFRTYTIDQELHRIISTAGY